MALTKCSHKHGHLQEAQLPVTEMYCYYCWRHTVSLADRSGIAPMKLDVATANNALENAASSNTDSLCTE